jgi:hypothetical protein
MGPRDGSEADGQDVNPVPSGPARVNTAGGTERLGDGSLGMEKKNKGAIEARKVDENVTAGRPGELVTAWIEEQPLKSWLLVFLVLALMDGDKGVGWIQQTISHMEGKLFKEAQDPRADIDNEMRMMLGAWSALDTIA